MEKKSFNRCPLCGGEFSDSEIKCKGCLISKDCGLLCCPHCGFSYKERSALVDFFKSLWRKVKR